MGLPQKQSHLLYHVQRESAGLSRFCSVLELTVSHKFAYQRIRGYQLIVQR